ncbi:hypothetical protein UCRPC4_g00347 [Phaeomoniella chlamydospora]|uniref:Uncharacterized protein n=1 Tax=Phaeomoniella chlamydospora TaxID=158046 RepID=A0A0G2H0I6_PHACM|nr:hypothetical protein UCRPC4_g00347 [Phaeomoniella chlamydospora]
MRFFLLSFILAVLAIYASAASTQKAVIVSYPNNTPGHVIEEAKDIIREAGGVITHEYKLFKGFAAKASVKALESVNALATEFAAHVEEDTIVSIDGDLV